MNNFLHQPKWRPSSAVRICSHPNKAFFDRCEADGVGLRFTAFEDGLILFGDAYSVLHRDMLELHLESDYVVSGQIRKSLEGEWVMSHLWLANSKGTKLRDFDQWSEIESLIGHIGFMHEDEEEYLNGK